MSTTGLTCLANSVFVFFTSLLRKVVASVDKVYTGELCTAESVFSYRPCCLDFGPVSIFLSDQDYEDC